MAGSHDSAVFLGATALLCLGIAAGHVYVSSTVLDPYMDEIFHVPQTQAYCAGNWTTWDNMITTLPGTYYSAVGMLDVVTLELKGLAWLRNSVADAFGKLVDEHTQRSIEDAISPLRAAMDAIPTNVGCSTVALRVINSIYTIAIFWVASHIRAHFFPADTMIQHAGVALAVATLPVLFFFNFLFYTDLGSLFYVLLSFDFILYGHNVAGGLVGAVAVLFRQTNILWVALGAAYGVVRLYVDHGVLRDNYVAETSRGTRRSDTETRTSVAMAFVTLLRNIPRMLPEVVRSFWVHILVALGFAAFIWLNEGIVVGDRSAHEPVAHFAQIPYFVLFAVASSAPSIVLVNLPSLCRKAFSSTRALAYYSSMLAVLSIVFGGMLYRGALAHKYLLADNRHFTFYLWGKALRFPQIRAALGVPSAVGALLLMDAAGLLGGHQHQQAGLAARAPPRGGILAAKLFHVFFAICTCAVLVPAHLVEIRYFIVPYTLLSLTLRRSQLSTLLELFVHLGLNCAVLWLFVSRPFIWEHDEHKALQRFMW